jgi:hypothetical protein
MHAPLITNHRRRDALLLIVLALLVAVAIQAMFTIRPAAAATRIGTVVGPACPDVMVIAARGSGEKPQADWTDPGAYRDPATAYGAGNINHDFYQHLVLAAPQLHFALDPVQYPADPPTEAVTGIVAFHQSEESGVTTILDDVARTELICQGGVKYVFAGYSQGAWAVHEALWKLSTSMPHVMGKIVGVALFGDPELVPFESIIRDNKVLLGLAPGVARVVVPGVWFPDAYSGVPSKQLQKLTASYCSISDGICQATPDNVALLLTACQILTDPFNGADPCPHTRYILDGQTVRAARFVIPNLPSKTVWPHLTLSTPPSGTVGTAYAWTATAAPTAKTRYTWQLLGASPPGLTFSASASGVLSGCPTLAGTYNFHIRATSVPQGRTADGAVSITVKPGSACALPPPPGCATTCTVRAWGYNGSGELGDGTTSDSAVPLQVSGLTGVTAIAGGFETAYALRSDGTVWAWGDDSYGQLGDGTSVYSAVPVQVSGLTGVTAIAGGFRAAYALRADGTVWAWGDNSFWQLGDGTAVSSWVPVQVSGLTGVTAIAGGFDAAFALRADGTVWAWGLNGSGALGDGTAVSSAVPVQVSGLTGVTAIAAASDAGFALRADGTVWAWGYNGYGELGDGTTTDSPVPVQVSGLTTATAIAGGAYAGYALVGP